MPSQTRRMPSSSEFLIQRIQIIVVIQRWQFQRRFLNKVFVAVLVDFAVSNCMTRSSFASEILCTNLRQTNYAILPATACSYRVIIARSCPIWIIMNPLPECGGLSSDTLKKTFSRLFILVKVCPACGSTTPEMLALTKDGDLFHQKSMTLFSTYQCPVFHQILERFTS